MRIKYESSPLGVGGFGRVYKARTEGHGEESRVIALKKARCSDYVTHPGLLHEACGLVLVKDHPSIPQVFGWGKSQFYEYLALELLDCDLSRRFKKEPLTRTNFVSLVLQMIAAVKHVHANGILHCDIKPDNFMFGLGPNAGRIYLIDFNLWTAWRSLEPPYKHFTSSGRYTSAAEGFRGTYRYASINCHLNGALSRRDDLESLAYSIFVLYAAGLPWSKLDEKHSEQIVEYKQVCQKSRALQGTCEYPLGNFVYYAQELAFRSKPDYDRWREEFWRVDNENSESVPESDPLYDPADTTEKVPRNMDFVDWSSAAQQCCIVNYPEKRNGGRMKTAPGSDGDYCPQHSSWGAPLTMLSEDTISHGQNIIRDVVQHISQPPTTTFASQSESCSPEEMRSFDAPIPFKVYRRNGDEDSGEGSDGEVIDEAEIELDWTEDKDEDKDDYAGEDEGEGENEEGGAVGQTELENESRRLSKVEI